MRRQLRDKVMVITGASSGIGAATAMAASEAGMHLALAARRTEELEKVAQSIEQIGGQTLIVTCDVDRDEDVQSLIEQTLERWGHLDVAFANAGYGLYGKVAELMDEEMRAIFETNYFGTVRLIRASVPVMKEQGHGHILICSSAVSEIGLPMYGAYCATKAAQDAISCAMRAELAHENIDVSSVHPIGTRTPFYDLVRTRSHRTTASFNTPSALQQDAKQVALAVLKCLRRPKPEVWPHWPSRLGLAMVTAFPILASTSMKTLMRKRYPHELSKS